MSNLDSVLNSIYCLSQEAASTITNLRAYPQIVKNSCSYKLYIHLEELHVSALQAYKESKLDLLERDLNSHFAEILSKISTIEETYATFLSTIYLPPDHFLIRKLKLQVNNILLMLIRLSQISNSIKRFDDRDFVAQ